MTPTGFGVHLVGSIPLSSTEEVFGYVCKELPGRLRRIPDGETAQRNFFTYFQRDIFPQGVAWPWGEAPVNFSPEQVEHTIKTMPPLETGYDDAAFASYAVFKAMRDKGVIPKETRFQICLPTTINVIFLLEPGYRAAMEPLYEAALLQSLERIQAAIPSLDLAIQIDAAVEFAMLEGVDFFLFKPWFNEPVRQGVLERLVRLANAVDEDVELGFHLCYGDIEHEHHCQPKDLGIVVDVATALFSALERPVSWLHMPVPKERDDEEYFWPLAKLQPHLRSGVTEIYLGLVHAGDEQGTQRRLDAANEAHGSWLKFGVATECGMGRTPPDELGSIFDISAKFSRPNPWHGE